MKTTIDLPEDLVREMKFRAVRDGRKLREVAEEVFRRGLAAPAALCRPGGRYRFNLPLVPSPSGAKLFELSGKHLLDLEMEAEQANPARDKKIERIVFMVWLNRYCQTNPPVLHWSHANHLTEAA